MPNVESLRVQKNFGQEALLLARKLGFINRSLMVTTKEDYVIIPLSRRLSEDEIRILECKLKIINFSYEDFKPKSDTPKTLTEALRGNLPSSLFINLPKSLDVIGNVAILEVPQQLDQYKHVLGKAVLQINKKIETVLAKASSIGGERRLREFEVIAGTGKTETLHREYGCVYRLDPVKVYFSPRLSTEHCRVAHQVMEDEIVVDMFAGVGPFAVQIGRSCKNVTIYAIDLNPDAIKYLMNNISLNNVEGKVIPVLGDAREIGEKNLCGIADRVIMNLPGKALEFIDVACRILKPKGGIIHYYCFEDEPATLERAAEELQKIVISSGRKAERILCSRFVRPIAPHEWQIVLDVAII
ncbi:MAG: Class SAM-dependent methyltransferase family protein [Thermoproteota archaeon]|nr:Class SAM-dependent methyltransferase family protein [Thermoproteota archaeon]